MILLCGFEINPIFAILNLGRVAQLVQSIWFTPRRSGVRIPSRPQSLSV